MKHSLRYKGQNLDWSQLGILNPSNQNHCLFYGAALRQHCIVDRITSLTWSCSPPPAAPHRPPPPSRPRGWRRPGGTTPSCSPAAPAQCTPWFRTISLNMEEPGMFAESPPRADSPAPGISAQTIFHTTADWDWWRIHSLPAATNQCLFIQKVLIQENFAKKMWNLMEEIHFPLNYNTSLESYPRR